MIDLLLVIISITGLFSAYALGRYHYYKEREELFRKAAEIVKRDEETSE